VVIGLGNVALSDEGAAASILREFARRAPPGVEVIDAGLPGPGLLDLLQGREKAVIVDAIDGGRPAGTIYRFHPDDAVPDRTGRCRSLHEGNVLLYLKLAEALGMAPEEVVLVGVQPANLSPGEKLSPPVEKAVVRVAELVLAEVSRKTGEGKAAVGRAR